MHKIDTLGILVIFVLVTFYYIDRGILQLFFAPTVRKEVRNWCAMNFSNFHISDIFAILVRRFLQIFFAATVQRQVRNWRAMNFNNFSTGIFLSYWCASIYTNIFVSSAQWRVKVSSQIHFSLYNPKAIF